VKKKKNGAYSHAPRGKRLPEICLIISGSLNMGKAA